jgi:hypothetical protein
LDFVNQDSATHASCNVTTICHEKLAEDPGASIGSREVDVEHLHGIELLEDSGQGETRGRVPLGKGWSAEDSDLRDDRVRAVGPI